MNNPVLPSSLMSIQSDSDVDFGNKIFGNNTLKVGVVIDILEPDNEDNVSKVGTEYHVMAIEQDRANGINSSIYKNCLAMDSFGGIADFFQFKRRKPLDAKGVQDKASLQEQEGTIVLLLCLDGNAEKAIIIGQMKNPSRKEVFNEESGHSAEGEFNGLRYSVDDDGAFTVTFKGATDEDGVPKDDSVSGTQLKIEKDGSLEVNNATLSGSLAGGNRKPKEGEEEEAAEEEEAGEDIVNEKIRLDRTAMTLDIESRKDLTLKSDENVNIVAKKNLDLKIMDLVIAAEGKASIESGGPCSVTATGAFEVTATEITLTADTTLTLSGTQISLDGTMIQLGSGGTPAVTLSTQIMGVGNLGAPVMCTMIGPFSSAVFIAS